MTAYNGAVIYDCTDGSVIEQYDVPVPTAQAIFDMALKKGVHIQTYTDTHIVSCAEDEELAFIKGDHVAIQDRNRSGERTGTCAV